MTRRHVVVLGDYERSLTPALEKLLGEGYRVTGHHDAETDETVLRGRLADAQVVVVIRERTPLSGELIGGLSSLELLVTTGRGNTVVPHDGPPLLSTDSMASAPAEHTWALILSLARHVTEQQQRLRDGRWQDTLGRGLEGRVLGLIGFGRIAQRVAAVARAFGMSVQAYSPSLDEERAAAHGVRCSALEDLARSSDVISLHAKLTESARGLVDGDLLSLMKPDALLINTARSALIERDALLRTLSSGHLGGFAQDVFDEEPLPEEDPLRSLPRTLLTPHIGYATDSNFQLFAEHVAEDITEYFRGHLVRPLNRPRS